VNAERWLRRLWTACWEHRAVVLSVLAVSAVGTGVEAGIPLLTRAAIDDAVAGTTGTIRTLVSVLAALAILRFASLFARRYLAGKLSLDVQHDLRASIFSSLQRLDGAAQDQHAPARWSPAPSPTCCWCRDCWRWPRWPPGPCCS